MYSQYYSVDLHVCILSTQTKACKGQSTFVSGNAKAKVLLFQEIQRPKYFCFRIIQDLFNSVLTDNLETWPHSSLTTSRPIQFTFHWQPKDLFNSLSTDDLKACSTHFPLMTPWPIQLTFHWWPQDLFNSLSTYSVHFLLTTSRPSPLTFHWWPQERRSWGNHSWCVETLHHTSCWTGLKHTTDISHEHKPAEHHKMFDETNKRTISGGNSSTTCFFTEHQLPSSSGHNSAGSLFTSKKQKRVGSWCIWYFCHTRQPSLRHHRCRLLGPKRQHSQLCFRYFQV